MWGSALPTQLDMCIAASNVQLIMDMDIRNVTRAEISDRHHGGGRSAAGGLMDQQSVWRVVTRQWRGWQLSGISESVSA